ncbi:helix-turn-helix domain-containing protein [Paenibacillus thalictri]|nr:AraC family transcriptional regulator [Paenibacillus thalictri]
MHTKIKEPFSHSYGFRFREVPSFDLAQIQGVGWENRTSADYYWDGMQRGDEGLMLFQYTLSGRGSMMLEDQIHPLVPGKAFLVWIPSRHVYFFPKDSDHWEYVYILMKGERLYAPYLEWIQKMGHFPEFQVDSPPIRMLNTILEKAKQRQITDSFINSSYAYQFAIELSRSTSVVHAQPPMPDAIQKTLNYIELNYDRIGNLDDMADFAGLSKYYFLRQFQRYTGMTPLEYLNKLRIEKAAGLLRTTRQTVNEIASTVGFTDGNYFSKVFKSWVGMPPGKFRSEQSLAADHLFLN